MFPIFCRNIFSFIAIMALFYIAWNKDKDGDLVVFKRAKKYVNHFSELWEKLGKDAKGKVGLITNCSITCNIIC